MVSQNASVMRLQEWPPTIAEAGYATAYMVARAQLVSRKVEEP